MRFDARRFRSIGPPAASALGRLNLAVPPTPAARLRGLVVGEPVRIGPYDVTDNMLTVPIVGERRTDLLHFSVPSGFRAHPDLVAAALAPLLRHRHRSIHVDFAISEPTRAQIEAHTDAAVSASGSCEPRPPGRSAGLAFSGGMDSMAAWLLAPEVWKRIAIDFGAWFRRERKVFEPLHPDVICATDVRAKGFADRSWFFMATPVILFADHLDLGWIGFGTNFESSPWFFHAPGWSPAVDGVTPLPGLAEAVGLQGASIARGLTEFAGSLVVDRYAPERVEPSLASVARAGSEKSFRKRLAHDSAVAFREGHTVDLSHRTLPRRKITMWRSYPVDFALLILMAMYPPRFVERFIANIDPDVLQAARSIRPDFVFRCHPAFLDQIPPHMRAGVVQRMTEAGVEPYRDDDWPEYERLRRILGHHYALPD